MIHEEICTYEVCKLAKEKGFPIKEIKSWHYEYDGCPTKEIIDEYQYPNITQSLLQRWLREEKGLHITVPFDNNEFWWQIKNLANGDSEYGEALGFDTYELALEDALAYSLKNLV